MKSSLLRTDKELLRIYNCHFETVYRVCFMYMKNKYDTEDMVQSTFVKLMNSKKEFTNTEHEKAWLIRTAINTCKDHYRGRWSKTIPIEQMADVSVEQPFEIDETLDKVFALPSKYKISIYLYYYEGYTTIEIARMLNKKASTIRGHLYKGRSLLRMEMEGDIE